MTNLKNCRLCVTVTPPLIITQSITDPYHNKVISEGSDVYVYTGLYGGKPYYYSATRTAYIFHNGSAWVISSALSNGDNYAVSYTILPPGIGWHTSPSIRYNPQGGGPPFDMTFISNSVYYAGGAYSISYDATLDMWKDSSNNVLLVGGTWDTHTIDNDDGGGWAPQSKPLSVNITSFYDGYWDISIGGGIFTSDGTTYAGRFVYTDGDYYIWFDSTYNAWVISSSIGGGGTIYGAYYTQDYTPPSEGWHSSAYVGGHPGVGSSYYYISNIYAYLYYAGSTMSLYFYSGNFYWRSSNGYYLSGGTTTQEYLDSDSGGEWFEI